MSQEPKGSAYARTVKVLAVIWMCACIVLTFACAGYVVLLFLLELRHFSPVILPHSGNPFSE
jgi:hypothetical protein